jgi:hypothetical protein
MNTKPKQKIFPVHRVFGPYEVHGTIVCIPSPRPGVETELVKMLIDDRVETMVKNRMVGDLLSPPAE